MFWKNLPIPKRVLLGTLFLFVFALFFIGTFATLSFSKVFVKSEVEKTSNAADTITPGLPTPDPNAPVNILMLGYGGEGHDGGSLSDVIMDARVDPKNNTVTFISIPRDTWIEMPVQSDRNEFHKINFAFAIGSDDTKYPLKEPQYKGSAGGGEMAKFVASKVLGFPVQYFVAVDFNGFKKVVDDLGGVDVNVPQAFDDYYYPIKGAENLTCGKTNEEIATLSASLSGFELEKQFQCRYEHLHFDSGVSKMDGETALKFVRSRHSDTYGGDFSRSQRQFAVLTAIKGKLFELNAMNSWPDLFDQFTEVLRTDVDKGIIKSFVDVNGSKFDDYVFKTIYLSNENVFSETTSSDGQYILVPKEGSGNWDGVHKFVADQLGSD